MCKSGGGNKKEMSFMSVLIAPESDDGTLERLTETEAKRKPFKIYCEYKTETGKKSTDLHQMCK